MVVRFDDPEMSKAYEAEIPCEADPTPFAIELVRQAYREDPRTADRRQHADDDAFIREQAHAWSTADGSPLKVL